MIIQIRAPGGAGKSSLVRQLLREHNPQVVEEQFFPDPRPHKTGGKTAVLWRCDGDLHVLGKYDLASWEGGGGDFVSGPIGRGIIRHYAPRLPHLIWESKFGSTEFPKDEALDEWKSFGIIWGVLDTPYDECIRQTRERRARRGEDPGDFDQQRVARDRTTIDGYRVRGPQWGMRVETLNHDHAYEQLHDLLRSCGWQCTSDSCTLPKDLVDLTGKVIVDEDGVAPTYRVVGDETVD